MNELVLAAPEKLQLATVADQMASVELWAGECESIPELEDAKNQLAAIEVYLARTSKDGLARVAAASRRLEVRIGVLLGVTTPGERHDLGQLSGAPNSSLGRTERHELRRMAEHGDVVEAEIARSTDDAPATRRAVTKAIREQRASAPFSTDPEVALIERRRVITGHLDRLAKAWARFDDVDFTDCDKTHVLALRDLGGRMIRSVATSPRGTIEAAATIIVEKGKDHLRDHASGDRLEVEGGDVVTASSPSLIEEEDVDHAAPSSSLIVEEARSSPATGLPASSTSHPFDLYLEAIDRKEQHFTSDSAAAFDEARLELIRWLVNIVVDHGPPDGLRMLVKLHDEGSAGALRGALTAWAGHSPEGFADFGPIVSLKSKPRSGVAGAITDVYVEEIVAGVEARQEVAA